MNINRLVIALAAFLMSVSSWALGMPEWVTRLPQAGNDTYYYRVTKAEGATYEDAYIQAFSMAILESQWKLGVKVNKSGDQKTIEKTIKTDLNLQSSNMNLPMNKVCEYEKASPKGGVILYILWQVASYGNIKVEFENFLDCN